MHLIDPSRLLLRTDKWQLGNGGPLIYAPHNPQHLDVPGFWDECRYEGIALPRLLCVSFALEENSQERGQSHLTPHDAGNWSGGRRTPPVLKPRGRRLVPLFPYVSYWHWHPDAIHIRYYLVKREGIGYKQQAGIRIFVDETRSIAPDGSLRCELSFDVLKGYPTTPLHVVAWTMQRWSDSATLDGRALHLPIKAADNNGRPTKLDLRIAGSRKPVNCMVGYSEEPPPPELKLNPLWTRLGSNKSIFNPDRSPSGEFVSAGLRWKLRMDADNPPKLAVEVSISKAGRSSAGSRTTSEMQLADWDLLAESVPYFDCDDEMLTRMYWYRLHVLRMNFATSPSGLRLTPAIAEDWKRNQVLHSAMYETRWLPDPKLAIDCLVQFAWPLMKDAIVSYLPASLVRCATELQAMNRDRRLSDRIDRAVRPFSPNESPTPIFPPQTSNTPYFNSILLDSFVAHHTPLSSTASREAALFLRRSIELMHYPREDVLPLPRGRRLSLLSDTPKDYSRPNSFVSYRYHGAPDTQGPDDILTGWPADQLIRYAAGLRYKHGLEPGWIVDPLPLGLSHFLLRGARIAGRVVDVGWRRDRDGSPADTFRVYLDGECVHERRRLGRWRLPL